VNRLVPRALTLLACVLACAVALPACGGDDGGESDGPRRLLAQTFETTATKVKSGRLNVDAKLEPEGILALGGPITAKITGPFTAGSRGLPRFDLDVRGRLARENLPARAISDGRRVHVELDRDFYVLPDRFFDKLRSGGGAAGIIALGIDPRKWITDVEEKGDERLGGVETVRLTGGIDVPRLLADAQKIIGSLIKLEGSAQQRKEIADAVKSADVQVWSGKEDKILRQILVRAAFEFPPNAKTPIPGLDKGKIELRASIDDVNDVSEKIRAPSRSKPFSQLPEDGVAGFVKCLTETLPKGSSALTCAANFLSDRGTSLSP
jgi:hypothetical protein